ncbi:MAG: aquaporin [Chloroflexota bacterium]
MSSVDVRRWAAELVGTFFFLFVAFMGVTSTLAFSSGDSKAVPELVIIALGFGLGLFAAIHIAGSVSGGHYNPAVTIAALADGRIDVVNAVFYIIAQVVGSVGAALVVGAVFDQEAVKTLINAPNAAHGISDIDALVLEIIFTAIFIGVILTVTRLAAERAALAIGLTLAVIHMALVPFTGTSVNPARSLGPAIIGGDLTSIWIFLVGPIVGGLIGWAVYRLLIPATDA